MNQSDAHAQYFVSLCAAALHHRPLPAAEMENFDESFLVKLITAHHMSGLLYPLFEKTPGLLSAQAHEILRREFKKDQMRSASQVLALEEISQAFSENHIRFMLMKGIIQKRYYEKSYHRMMSDLDLLIDSGDRARVRERMEALGYETQLYEELYDDVYYRRPFLNVEIHVALGEDHDFTDPYFDEIWSRAKQDLQNPYCYEMSPEDYYLYFIHHAAKHCKGHGTGIRTLVDIWYLKKRLLPNLDRAFLDEKLSELGTLTFERELLALSEVWFDGKEGDLFQTQTMRRYLILEAGLYGNVSNAVFRHAIEDENIKRSQANKRAIFFKHIFLPRKNMSVKYPVLDRHAWLLPFCWIHRGVKILLSPQKIRDELDLYSAVTRGMDLHTELRMRFGFTSSSGSEEHGAE